MIGLARVSLGVAPGPRETADAQVRKFKEPLHKTLPVVKGVSLLQVRDVETQRVRIEAVYDKGDRVADAWVREAAGIAAEVWRVVSRTGTRELVR